MVKLALFICKNFETANGSNSKAVETINDIPARIHHMHFQLGHKVIVLLSDSANKITASMLYRFSISAKTVYEKKTSEKDVTVKGCECRCDRGYYRSRIVRSTTSTSEMISLSIHLHKEMPHFSSADVSLVSFD